MGRKKRPSQKSKDPRGYSRGGMAPQTQTQQPSSLASRSLSLSTRAHGEMKGLLDRLGDADGSKNAGSSSSAAPSERFGSRLSKVVDRLDELGFTEDQVERAVRSLRYEITVEGALDWLCLNLDTLELPSLFTDGVLRQDLSMVTTADSLTVLRAISPEAGGIDSQAENVLVMNQASSDKKLEETGNGNESDGSWAHREKEQKRWLLQKYGYEDEGDDVRGSPEIQEENSVKFLTPEEQRLAKEERDLAELKADLNNDANNYMRSKDEIAKLRIREKKLRQQVAGLRRKIERSKARQQQLEKDKCARDTSDNADRAAVCEKVEVEEYGCGFFDVFAKDHDNDEDETPTTGEKALTEAAKILNFTIPKGWTGSTPQKKLEEVLKKRNFPKAKYVKLPMNEGLSLTITLDETKPAQTWEAKSADFRKGSTLKDYLATHALYAIDPTVPQYQVFPPTFRCLWLSWMDQKKDEGDRIRQLRGDAKQQRVDHLMSLISSVGTDRSIAAAMKGDSRDSQGNGTDAKNGDTIIDIWDNCTTNCSSMKSSKTHSIKGEKMQTDFARQQSTQAYGKMKAIRDKLPMASYRSDVLETVQNNSVTILCAETGAGKSTQCAQYILEEALLNFRGDAVNIICSQPRRVAATSLAERVAEEMGCRLGKMVGYQIRMESKRSAHTRLLFCTTGIILRRFQDNPSLLGITHVIVDEVHERQQETDVLLIILRQLLQTTRPDLKVILMSATIETELFRSYFQGAPIISVPGRTFPVLSYYLEDLLDATDHIIEECSRYALREKQSGDMASIWVTARGGEKRKQIVDLTSQVEPGEVSNAYADYKMSTCKSMERVNEEIINYDLIEDVLKLITDEDDGNNILEAPDGADMSKGSILIFLPGLGEIRALIERLEGIRSFENRFDLIPLHSTLSSRDQRRAFLPSESGRRKVIAATNIAETSITVPDVVYVIDSGRVREVRRNKRTSTSMLVTDWCPRSSSKQRQGRAGRVQPGICLKLYSATTADVMKATNEPELRRVPLEEICMTILASGFANNCGAFLDLAPQPPPEESVQAAMNTLYGVGAVERISSQGGGHQLECLTPLGNHLSKLPVDVKLGRMLIFGSLFECIDPILTIAASLSSKSPFSTFVDDAAVAKANQRVFAHPDSDFITYVNVWDAYSKAAETSASVSRQFCQDHYLNQIALREIGDARRQFLDLLCGIGFLDRDLVMDTKRLKSCRFNRHSKKPEVVHTVICAGLYPNVARLEKSASKNYTMWHKEEPIYFHSRSVNGAKKLFSDSDNWVVFHEKFGTPNRTSVSITAFVHPFALLLFGGSILVKHTERRVIIDEWMSIGMSAQTGVMVRELRSKVDLLLRRMIECANYRQIKQVDSSVIDGIIKILVS